MVDRPAGPRFGSVAEGRGRHLRTGDPSRGRGRGRRAQGRAEFGEPDRTAGRTRSAASSGTRSHASSSSDDQGGVPDRPLGRVAGGSTHGPGRRAVRLALTITVLAAVVVVTASSVGGTAPTSLVDVTVGPGDTLWSIAQDASPDRDPRAVIDEIRQLNDVPTDLLPVGIVLRVPSDGD